MLGIVVQFYSGKHPPSWAVYGFPVVWGIAALPRLSTHPLTNGLFPVSVCVFFGLLGSHLAYLSDHCQHPLYFFDETADPSSYTGRIAEPPQEKERSVKCIVNIHRVGDWQKMGKTLLYLEKDSSSTALEYGDILLFRALFRPIQTNGNPCEFDYKRYLSVHRIYHQAYVRSGDWIVAGKSESKPMAFIYGLRGQLSRRLEKSGLTGDNLSVAKTLLLGQREGMDRSLLRAYSDAGAMHVLAVSGLHVGIVLLLLNGLLRPLKRGKNGGALVALLLLIGIWLYALITGLSPSVFRASIMFSLIVVGKALQRDVSVYQSVLVSAFLLVLTDPLIIFQVGFQLSYLAVLGIVFLQPKVVRLVYFKHLPLRKAWEMTAVSIAAQLATFPLGMYYFHQFPNFFLLSNFLVVPLAFLLLINGIALFVCYGVPYLENVVVDLFDYLLFLLNGGVHWIEQLPHAVIRGISIEWAEVLLIYLAVAAVLFYAIYKKTALLWSSLTATVGLLTFKVYKEWQIAHSRQLIVYNIADEVGIDVFHGRQNTFYATEGLSDDVEKLIFHVHNNWFYRRGAEQPTEWCPVEKRDFIFFADKSALLLSAANHNRFVTDFPLVDIVVVHHLDFIDKDILHCLQSHRVPLVIGSGVSYRAKNFITSRLNASLIHDLAREGALVVPF